MGQKVNRKSSILYAGIFGTIMVLILMIVYVGVMTSVLLSGKVPEEMTKYTEPIILAIAFFLGTALAVFVN